jgi:hypothetical protein
MDKNFALLKNLEYSGDKYCKEERYLGRFNNKELENDWWESLVFFFSHSFMQGRPDELSAKYLYFTLDAIKKFVKIEDIGLDRSYKILKKNLDYFDKNIVLDFKNKENVRNCLSKAVFNKFFNEAAKNNKFIQLLISENKSIEVKSRSKGIPLGKDYDLLMVLDVLNFICINERKNIYLYFKKKIADPNNKKNIVSAYNELKQFSSIGDKISSFIIRDIGLLNPSLIVNHYELVFPVDTWVRKISEKIFGYNTDERIIEIFITQCGKNFDILKVAAGIWYLGKNSLDLLIDIYKREFKSS